MTHTLDRQQVPVQDEEHQPGCLTGSPSCDEHRPHPDGAVCASSTSNRIAVLRPTEADHPVAVEIDLRDATVIDGRILLTGVEALRAGIGLVLGSAYLLHPAALDERDALALERMTPTWLQLLGCTVPADLYEIPAQL